MNVVYLFYENGKIRIPFFGRDRDLFQRLAATRLGYWDQLNYQYIISQPAESDILRKLNLNRTCIEVGRNSQMPVIVHWHFSEDKHSIVAPGNLTAESPQKASVAPGTHPPSDKLPDKFPDHWQQKLDVELHSRKYSVHTRYSYVHYNRILCKWLQKFPEEVTPEDIKNYLSYSEKVLQLSASSLNLALSAFKFFYHYILKKDIVREQSRPHQDKRLPVVFSKAEVKAILDAEKNEKHRLLLMIVYSSGLRVSEVVHLKRQDVDLARKLIIVKSGKGRKDRYTILADTVITALKKYYLHNNISTWLFPGADPDNHLSIRSAQYICDNSIKKVQIVKNASIHSLRHTFATHLLEGGTDIRYIKELLGHSSLRTTERYTHIARRDTLKIISPIDSIDTDE
jgi:site-specific recombinase XerD